MKKNSFRLSLRVALAGALLLTSASFCSAVNSPVGTWDCVMSGPRQGVAYLTFMDDFSFFGHEIIVPNAPTQAALDARGGENSSRNDLGPGTNSVGNQIVGWEDPSGPWGFDVHGHLLGYFLEVTVPIYQTNYFPSSTNFSADPFPITATNYQGTTYCLTTPLTVGTITTSLVTNQTICYVQVVTATQMTNQLSFAGTVSPGKRLTLVCTTPFGHVTYRGVPAVSLPSASGSYYGAKLKNNQTFLEFFGLAPANDGLLNHYVITGNGPDNTGEGPGYFYFGDVLLSAQKQAAFSSGIFISTNFPNGLARDGEYICNVAGGFNPTKGTGNWKGWQGPLLGNAQESRVSFKVTRQP